MHDYGFVLDIGKHIPEPATKGRSVCGVVCVCVCMCVCVCVCVVCLGGKGRGEGGGGSFVPPTILFPVSSWDGCMSAQPVQDKLGLMVGRASKTLFSFSLLLSFLFFLSFFFFFFFSSLREERGRISSKHGALHAEVDSDTGVVG